MSKLAKVKHGSKRLAHLAYRGGDKVVEVGTGSIGGRIVRHGVHGVLGLVTKNYRTLGPIPVSPDVAGLVVGLGMALFGKKKTHKLGVSIADGAVSACISRMLYEGVGNFTIVNGQVIDSAGKTVVDAEAA